MLKPFAQSKMPTSHHPSFLFHAPVPNHHLIHQPQQSYIKQQTSLYSEFDKDYSKYTNIEEDASAKSQFGTKSYWDAMYEGLGDFNSEEYSWYYGLEVIKPHLQNYVETLLLSSDDKIKSIDKKELKVLIPGCGNDPLLLDLYNAGYTTLTGFDYSGGAIERQLELMQYLPSRSNVDNVELCVQDARCLPSEWEERFDLIIEKGALDAIYLSGDGNFEQSVLELGRVLKVGGVCISCSGVVPADLRREGFADEDWEWLRDGTDDLKAGCFVLKKR